MAAKVQKILITGANGFVGQHVLAMAAYLWPETDIWACARQAVAADQKTLKAVHWTVLDMLDAAALEALVKDVQPDAVLHLAAASSVGYSWQQPRESTLNNLNIYLNLLEAARLHAPQTRILSVGSSEVYGSRDAADLPFQENHVLKPNSPYAVARASQEALSKIYVDGYGLDIVMTRSFNHFGPGQDGRFALPSFARQIAAAKTQSLPVCVLNVGNIDVVRDFTDVQDVVMAYMGLLQQGQTGEIYNICSGVGRSLRDVIQAMGDVGGYLQTDTRVSHRI